MFNELPETIPHKNKTKFEAFAGALAVQVVLVGSIIVLQMALPQKLGEFQLLQTLYMAPPPPPAPAAKEAPAPAAVRHQAERPSAATQPTPVAQQKAQPVQEQPAIIAPTAIPSDIARIVESGAAGRPGSVPGGVVGGVGGGVAGGTLGGVLGGAAVANVPPPPATGPVRVGGNVKQPKLVHIEQPHYPPAAKAAHIEGVVVVEATVTADGTVDKVKVLSGPPTLTEAASEAVSHWKYEPTYLNGQAVPVILTARITFSLSDAQK
ncbi:MAG TPA: energy transducer TonB [Terriglobia bacterium]|jgi:protein TonB